MIRKDEIFKWPEENESFYRIKEVIVGAADLRRQYYEKELILYTFTYYISYAAILTQKNEEGNGVAISFLWVLTHKVVSWSIMMWRSKDFWFLKWLGILDHTYWKHKHK